MLAALTPAMAAAFVEEPQPTWRESMDPREWQGLLNEHYQHRGEPMPYTKGAGTASDFKAERFAQVARDVDLQVARGMANGSKVNSKLITRLIRSGLFQSFKNAGIKNLVLRGSLYGGLGYLAFEAGSGIYKRWFGSPTLIEPGEIVSVQINTNDRTDLGGTICLWETLVYSASSCPAGSGQYLPRVELGGMYAYVEYDTPAKTWHPKTYLTYDPAVCPLYPAEDMLPPFYDDGAGYTATKMYWPTASVVCTHTTPQPVHFFRFDADALEYADPPMPIKPAEWPASSDTAITKVPHPPLPSLNDVDASLEDYYESPEGTLARKQHEWVAHKVDEQVVGQPDYWTHPTPTPLITPDPGTTSPATGIIDEASDCNIPLWHYTTIDFAPTIFFTRQLRSSSANPPYPEGAFATTIPPFAPLWTKAALSDHLFGLQKPVDSWVGMCAEDNPQFHSTSTQVPGAPSDYWHAAAPAGTLVPIMPFGFGVNPMP